MEMEELIRAKKPGYPWAIIRPTSIWGPWFGTPYKEFFDLVVASKVVSIKEKACTKTYGFVLNSVFQIQQLLLADKTPDEVYYIGDAPPLNITEWGNQIAAAANLKQPSVLPFWVFRLAGLCGDMLKKFGLPFPLTSFRVKNMTTNNIIPLDNLYAITGNPPYDTKEGIRITLNWINNN